MTFLTFPGNPDFVSFAATTTPTALPDKSGHCVEVFNNSGQTVIMTRSNASVFHLPTGNSKVFHVRANANELQMSVDAGTPTIDIEVWG